MYSWSELPKNLSYIIRKGSGGDYIDPLYKPALPSTNSLSHFVYCCYSVKFDIKGLKVRETTSAEPDSKFIYLLFVENSAHGILKTMQCDNYIP